MRAKLSLSKREGKRNGKKTLSRRVAFQNEILSERDYFKFFSFKGESFFSTILRVAKY